MTVSSAKVNSDAFVLVIFNVIRFNGLCKGFPSQSLTCVINALFYSQLVAFTL